MTSQHQREPAALAELRAIKTRLGAPIFLDLRALDWPAAHGEIGQAVRGQVQRILQRKLKAFSSGSLQHQIRVARGCLATIREKAASPSIPREIRQALAEYRACLEAWGLSALGSNASVGSSAAVVDGKPIALDELAMALQNDNLGCQTEALREEDGSVLFWHTEEDVEDEPGERFDKLRIAILRGETVDIATFIYPDLLPGPAFTWATDGWLQAVDALFLRGYPSTPLMLANVATWINIRLRQHVDPEVVIRALMPFIDGYAMLVARPLDDAIVVTRYEFAHDVMITSELPPTPGSYLVQANVCSDRDSPLAVRCESLDHRARRDLEARTAMMERTTSQVMASSDRIASVLNLLSLREGGTLAYSNVDVKAYFLAQLKLSGHGAWIGAGPALLDDQPVMISIPESDGRHQEGHNGI
ncbi:MAG: hypothetical protein GX620_16205 [Chloroflexi bacterium]|nr:hypothetical protein [Chloroflexota bacterium]